MEKWTVVIPTIWKSEYTLELLNRYINSEYVGEVILINNRDTEAPEIPKNDKLKVITPNENIYVNPAWNKGVELALNNKITISNDDILFDVEQYYRVLEHTLTGFQFQSLGFIGSHSDNYKGGNAELSLEVYNNVDNTGGWGCLFSFHKSNWKPIPEQLKIWYGDNHIHRYHNVILQLRGIDIQTRMSTSSDDMSVREVRDNDTIEWHKLFNNLISY